LGNAKSDSQSVSVEIRGQLVVGQEVEIISPEGSIVCEVHKISNHLGKPLASAHGGTGIYDIDFGVRVPTFSILSAVGK
jgi:hypothetical protein